MHLVNHGGKCCGIKTIYELGTDPQEECLSLDETTKNSDDIMYRTVSSNKRFFHKAAPPETRLERLDRYLDFVKTYRPSHIVEVTLAECPQDSFVDQRCWFPLLEERGFKRVTSAKNSNSGNIVHVYHLVIEKGEVVK